MDETAVPEPVAVNAAMAGTDAATYTRERPRHERVRVRGRPPSITPIPPMRAGLDGLWGMYQWLDRAPRGRNENGRLVAPPRRSTASAERSFGCSTITLCLLTQLRKRSTSRLRRGENIQSELASSGIRGLSWFRKRLSNGSWFTTPRATGDRRDLRRHWARNHSRASPQRRRQSSRRDV